LVCIAALLWQVPGGLSGIVTTAKESDKFSLGSFWPQLNEPTFWVVLVYGLTINLGNFGIDQSYVQRYVTTSNAEGAKRSVWIAAVLYVPVAAVFFFIGTGLFALHALRPEVFPPSLDVEGHPDAVFPFFIAQRLPIGMSGLVVAAIFAASMDSSLSSMATLTLTDIYQRYFRPKATERESMFVLHASTIVWGVLGASAALAMMEVKKVLDVWWNWAGILSGGMLGLFLLGIIWRRVSGRVAALAVIAGLAVIVWMTISTTPIWPESLDRFRNPFHEWMTIVFGTATILIVGLALTALGFDGHRSSVERQPRE